MSRTAACRERSPFARVAAVWSLATGLLLAAVSPPLQACDGGTAADPGNTGLVEDCKVLLALRDELVGSGSLNWDTQFAIASWQGVRVLGSPSRVRVLDLDENQLTGAIPAELGQLSQLTRLDLGENQLTGAIPAELGQLSQLRWLILGENQLTGAIPAELGRLTYLRGLSLDNNQLTGAIPAELGRLTDLRGLSLGNNQLTGAIPAELGDLTYLQILQLYDNELSGAIPAELGQLSRLEQLHLQRNQLTGTIPAELGQLSRLQQFSFRGNRLTGPVPPELRHLPDVYVFNFAAKWVGPGQIKATWDDPLDPTASYEYQFYPEDVRRGVNRIWSLWAKIENPETTLRAGEGVTIEWMLTGLPAWAVNIGVRARTRTSVSPRAVAYLKPLETPGAMPEPVAADQPTLVFPQYINGVYGGFSNRTRLILRNLAATANPVTVSYLDTSGQVVDSEPYTVPGNGTVDIRSSGTGDLTVGPLTVASSSSQLHGTVIYEFLGYLVSVPASELTTEAEIFISKSADENTGLALYNPSATNNVTLELVLHTADGNAFYRIYVTLEPGQHLARFVDGAPLFDAALGQRQQFTGHTVITSSSGRFAVVSLLQDTATGALAAVSPVVR